MASQQSRDRSIQRVFILTGAAKLALLLAKVGVGNASGSTAATIASTRSDAA